MPGPAPAGAAAPRGVRPAPATPPRVARRGFGHAEVYAASAALSFAVARWVPVLELGWGCPFRAWTGVPCATCGMTHAFVHLAHGDLARALAASPLGAALAAAAWLFAIADAVRLAAGWPLPVPGPRAARGLAVALTLAALANWAFVVVASRA